MGNSLLVELCEKNDFSAINEHKDKNKFTNVMFATTGASKETPLVVACNKKNTPLVLLLLNILHEININRSQEAVLAGKNYYNDVVSGLYPISTSPHVNKAAIGNTINARIPKSDECTTAFFAAIQNGLTSVVSKMLELRADINNPTYENKKLLYDATIFMAPVHVACAHAQFDVVKLLINSGADVRNYSTIQHNQTYGPCKHFSPVMWLVNPGSLPAPLTEDQQKLSLPLIDELVKKKEVDVNYMDSYRQTALQLACRNKYELIAIKLVELKANPSICGAGHMSGLNTAVSCNMVKVVAKLLEYKADLHDNTNNPCGNGPLHTACVNGNAELAMMLLEAGANPEVPNKNGKTALMLAHEKGLSGVVEKINSKKDTKVVSEMDSMKTLVFMMMEKVDVLTEKVGELTKEIQGLRAAPILSVPHAGAGASWDFVPAGVGEST